MTTSAQLQKSADAFRTISEVAEALKLPQHVLRFWETRFTQIKPLKRAGGRRFYRPEDVELLSAIRKLLYGEGYTIRGVQRILKEQGPRAVAALARGAVPPAPTVHDTQLTIEDGDLPSVGAIEADAQRARVPGPLDQDVEAGHAAEAADFGEPRAAAPGQEPSVNPDFTSRRAPDDRVDDGPRTMPGSPIEAANRLRAVLAELAECRRLLVAASQ